MWDDFTATDCQCSLHSKVWTAFDPAMNVIPSRLWAIFMGKMLHYETASENRNVSRFLIQLHTAQPLSFSSFAATHATRNGDRAILGRHASSCESISSAMRAASRLFERVERAIERGISIGISAPRSRQSLADLFFFFFSSPFSFFHCRSCPSPRQKFGTPESPVFQV